MRGWDRMRETAFARFEDAIKASTAKPTEPALMTLPPKARMAKSNYLSRLGR